MKKFMIIHVILVLATVTAIAQSSGREGASTRSNSENSSQSSQVESGKRSSSSSTTREQGTTPTVTSERSSSTSTSRSDDGNTVHQNQRSSNAQVSRSNTNANSGTSRQPENRNTTTTRQSTTTTTTRQPANNTSNTRVYRESESRNSNSTVTNNHGNRSYHSDVRYSTPRSNVRTVHVHDDHNRKYHHHHQSHTVIVREPVRSHIVWDVHMHREYRDIYPYVRVWRIERGTPIYSIPAYNAMDYIGDVKKVYGIVREVYYDPTTDDYYLYFGDYFPYHDFTAIVPGYVARQITRRPYRYFKDQYMWVTGYISEFEGRAEIVVKRNYQVNVY